MFVCVLFTGIALSLQFLSTIRTLMQADNSSVVDSCPPEIWTQIFYHACTDTGFTGRSVSATSRYFHELVKAIKLRSVALFNIKQIAKFVELVEALPCWERVVENLYLTTYGLPSPNSEASDDAYPPANAQVREDDVDQIYGPGSDVVRPSTVNTSNVRLWAYLNNISGYFPGQYSRQ